MKKIDLNVLCEESFIDNQIISSDVDIKNKKIIIRTNGAGLNDRHGTNLFKAEIVIENWHKLYIIERNGVSRILDSLPDKFLKSIMGFHYDNIELILTDVGYNCWVDWVFLKPTFSVYGATKKEIIEKFISNCVEPDEIPASLNENSTLEDFHIKHKELLVEKIKDKYGVDLKEVHFRSFKLPLWRILDCLEGNSKVP